MSRMFNNIDESYKNKKFSFEGKSKDKKIVSTIKGKSIDIKKGNNYYSFYFSYHIHPQVTKLARKVINNIPGLVNLGV